MAVAVVVVFVTTATFGVSLILQNGTVAPAVPRPPPGAAPVVLGTGAKDDALAIQLAVRPEDVGSRWVPLQAQSYPASVLNVSMTCLPAAPAGRRSAGAVRAYSLDLQPSGLESGHLTSVILLQASPEAAAITRSRILAAGYDACGQGDALSQVTTSHQHGAHVAAVSALPLPGALTGIAERLSISFNYDGAPDMVTTDFFDVLQGRVEIRTFIQKCSCEPFDSGFENGLVQSLATRAQASTYGQ